MSHSDETHSINLDVPGILVLLSEHLYSNPRTALREVIQNAHDSCLRRLVEDPHLPPDYSPKIDISLDPEERTLTIADNGSGLTANEIDRYLATIGRGYTGELRDRLAFGDHAEAQSLIGQFGLGLLSAFQVAHRLAISTRSYQPGEPAWQWQSTGGATYSLEKIGRQMVGTTFTLHLKLDGEFLLNTELAREAIRLYADFLRIPITLNGRDPAVNAMDAPWYRTSERRDYEEFVVKQAGWPAPLSLVPLHDLVEDLPGNMRDAVHTALRGVLVIPDSSSTSFTEYGELIIYVRRMFITDAERDLLPRWARFVFGLIDSPDLSPTASRESIRHDETFYAIQRGLEVQLLEHFRTLASDQPKIWSRIVHSHNEMVKSWALESGEFFDLIADLVMVPTNVGDLSLSDVAERSGGTIICWTDAQDTALANMIGQAYSGVLVNATGFTEAAFLEEYSARHPGIEIARFESILDAMLAPAGSPSAYQSIVDYYSGQGIDARVVQIGMPEIPAFLYLPADGSSTTTAPFEEAALESSIGYLVGEFKRLSSANKDAGARFYLNASSPLITRLAEADPGTPRWTAVLEVIYSFAQILSGQVHSPDQLRLSHSLLSHSLDQLLGPESDSQADA